MNKQIQLNLIIAASLSISACSNTFSGRDDAYIQATQQPASKTPTQTALSSERQYYAIGDLKADQHYQAPSVVPPGESLATKGGPSTTLIGRGHSVLAVHRDLSDVWSDLEDVLAKTPYSVMDHDESLYTYFIVDKVKTGGKIKRSSPIYQLALSHHNGVTELHLVNTKHQPVATGIAHRVMLSIQQHYTKS